MIVCRGGLVQTSDIALADEHGVLKGDDKLVTLEEYERGFICTVLDRVGWVVKGEHGAAAVLGLNLETLVFADEEVRD